MPKRTKSITSAAAATSPPASTSTSAPTTLPLPLPLSLSSPMPSPSSASASPSSYAAVAAAIKTLSLSSSMSALPSLAMYVLLLALTLFINGCAAFEYSWCDASLCTPGVRHIACRTNGAFHKRCASDAVELDISAFKDQFVHEHNKRRNLIASGQIPGYYPASRMASMVWDDELQYLASLNLRTCILDHDPCHNTFRFKNVGQNLCGLYRNRSPHVNISSLIEQTMNLWFDEYPLIDSTYIDSFRVTRYFEDYGHFAEMVVDRNAHVGCGIIRFTRTGYPHVYIYNVVCNYGSIYALDTPVYTVGRAGTGCHTGRNPYYPGLCSTRERINPNYE